MPEPLAGAAGLTSARRRLLQEALEREGIRASGASLVAKRSSQGPPPLSFAQQRLWFLDQLDPGNGAYNLPKAVRLTGALDVAALRGAWREIVRRHEVLRTSFPAADGTPVQRIDPPGPAPIALIDLAAVPAVRREPAAHRLGRAFSVRSFSLHAGPLWRACLLRFAADDHVLVIVLHHTASDGWSTGILMRELAMLYRAAHERRPSPLPELPVQYADFAEWQRRRLEGPLVQEQLAYWRRQLAGLEPLALPVDRPRVALSRRCAAQITFRLDPGLSHDLREVARREGVTLFMVLLAAFQVSLARWTNQADIAVGTVISSRPRPELESLIGFFVNPLVLRTDLSGSPTFATVLKRVRQVTLDAYARQDVPFERLVDELATARDLDRAPLVQASLVFQNTPVPQAVALSPGLTARDWGSLAAVDPGDAGSDLALYLAEERGCIRGDLDYDSDVLERSTPERFLAHWRRILAHAVAAPACRIGEVPLLDEAERDRVVRGWNATAVDYGAPVCLHELVSRQAARTPGATAVAAVDGELTYAELDCRAHRLAHHLRRLGVGPETRVGVCLDRTTDLVVGLLGVLHAGGAYVPLDPGLPAERLAFIAGDAGVSVLVTVRDLPGEWIAGGHRAVVHLDRDAAAIAASPAGPPDVEVDPENAAYVMYTSGSTGAPKGVVVTHRNVHNQLMWMDATYGISPADRMLHKASFAVDASVLELFCPLMAGARLVLAEPGRHRDLEYLSETIATHRITASDFTPAMLRAFVREGWLQACGGLRQIFCGGEQLEAELSDRCLRVWPGSLHNQYGPTETTVNATSWECRAGEQTPQVPIGPPIANTQAYVLDAGGEPVPIGVPGELYIGGTGVARGYVNRPGLTAERFVPDPFGNRPGARLYRTGDVVRWRDDGVLVYDGRTDQQVKIRGYRVELEEIEAVIRRHPGVRDAAVAVRENGTGSRELVGYWVTAPGASVDEAALCTTLRARLPDYMVPKALVPLAALPLTASAKIDRRALPPPPPPVSPAEGRVPPRTETERILCRVWEQVLQREAVGIDDNFFDLGGDSILSIQIVARAGQAGVKLSVRQVFAHQTIAELAAVAQAARAVAPQGRVTGAVPLTPIQHEFLAQARIRPSHYNQSTLLLVRQPLAPGALRAAFAAIVEQHDALRLRVAQTAAGWTQWHADAAGDVFCEVDLSPLAPHAHRRALERLAARLQRSLDLALGPLLRVAYVRLGGGASRLVVVIHHWVVDGVSWRILLEDVELACAQHARGEPVRLPPKTSSFQQWGQALVAHAASPATAQERHFWRAAAAKESGTLSPDRSGDNVVASVTQVRTTLSAPETRMLLEEAPRGYGSDIQAVLLTALVAALGERTGQWCWRIDLEGHGREEISSDLDVSRTVGWFTTVYPLALALPAAGTSHARVRAMHEQLAALPQYGLGYGVLRYSAGDDALAGAGAEIAFNYLGQFDQMLKGLFGPAAESAGPIQDPRERRQYLLEVDAEVVNGSLHATWHFSSAVHERATVAALADAFMRELQTLVADSSTEAGEDAAPDFSDVDLTEEEMSRLLARIDT